jgi:hypothetical protein
MKYTSLWLKILSVLVLLLVLASAGASVYMIFGKMNPEDKARLYLEAAKSLFYLITVLLIGAFITAVIKSFEKNRKADKALHDFRLEFLNRLQATYQCIKKSRHLLCASGLTDRFKNLPPALSKEHAAVYAQEMTVIQEVHSEVERLILEADCFPGLSSSRANHVKLGFALKDMERYLSSLLEEYEKNWPKVQATPTQVVFTMLPKLQDFTSYFPQANYQKLLASPYDRALVIIRDDLLPLKTVVAEAKKEPSGGVIT